MKFLRKIQIPIVYLLVFCFTRPPCNGQENDNSDVSNKDAALFHKEMSRKRVHLLAHLADRMDLDGEGLRHIKKHMGEVIGDSKESKDIQDVADGDNMKGIFYFFKFHDYDNNEKLDGLEWMKALTDFHQEDSGNEDVQAGGPLFLDHEAEAIVDELLKKHDMNDDGMIDFFELMNSRVESLMTDLDKEIPDNEGGLSEKGLEQHRNQNSLEQEYSRQQEQNQDSSEEDNDKKQQADEPQGHSEKLKESPSSEEEYERKQEQQQNSEQPQQSPSLEEEYKQQQDQDQQQQTSEKAAEEPSLEEEYNHQQDHEQQQQQQQQNSEQAVETPSLEEEYNRDHEQQEQHGVDQQKQHSEQPQDQENIQNVEQTEGDQSLEQEFNQQQREPSLEEEYNQQQQS